VIIGLVLILAGNAFTLVFLNIKVHELLANVGALFLLVGTLQWFFDEDSRQHLVSQVSETVRDYLDKRDRFATLGISDCLIDSKSISSPKVEFDVFVDSNNFAIGVHYSDGTIVRYEKVINERIAQGRLTQIAYVSPTGTASKYLSSCLGHAVDIQQRISQLLELTKTRFAEPKLLELVSHDRVLRYSFVYSDQCIWIIFITNSNGYQPQVPALRLTANSELFEFFKQDIKSLGIKV